MAQVLCPRLPTISFERPFEPPDFKFIQIKYRCVHIHTNISVYSCIYFIYMCICVWMYMQTHIPTCTLLPWCRLPGCFHPFRNFQHCCFDSAQHYLLLLCGHQGRASAWRTSVRQHCTCSQQAAPLRLRALHPTRAIIKEDRYFGVGEGSGCCSVCRQCEHLQPVGEIRAG